MWHMTAKYYRARSPIVTDLQMEYEKKKGNEMEYEIARFETLFFFPSPWPKYSK